MLIYKTTNLITGKIYIGKSNGKNPYYLGSGKYLKRSILKYGKQNFSFTILENDIANVDLLNAREIYWIAFYNSTDSLIGYNLTRGGDGGLGLFPNEETRRKFSIAFSGKNNGMYGKHHSQESKNKMSISKKGKGYYGKNLSAEHKEKIRLSNIEKQTGIKSQIFCTKVENFISKYVGVSFHNRVNKWTAKINKQWLGYFDFEIEAALAVNEYLLETFGWRVKERLNIISDKQIDWLWNTANV